MANKNDNLGGDDYVDDQVLPADDLNDTNDSIISLSMLGPAQMAFQQVQATTFVNQDYLAADIFSDADGKNNTVDTTSSTVQYCNLLDKYTCGVTDDSSGDTNYDPDSFTNVANAFDGNDTTYAYDATINGNSLGKTFAAKYVGAVRVKIEPVSVTYGGSDSRTVECRIETYDGSTWTEVGTVYTYTRVLNSTPVNLESQTATLTIDDTIQGIRIISYGLGGGSVTYTLRIYYLEYGAYTTDSSLVTDSDLGITLTGNETTLLVYDRSVNTANTSITVDITDGSTTISDQAVRTPIDISSLSSGTLGITFNLNTTDTSETPELYGYGVYVK